MADSLLRHGPGPRPVFARRNSTSLQPMLGLVKHLVPTVTPFASAGILAPGRQCRPVLSAALGTIRVGQHLDGLGKKLDRV